MMSKVNMQVQDGNDTGRRILLLDLVWTTAIRSGSPKGMDYCKVIWNTETYRSELIDRILDEGWYVILITGRSIKYREVTLANLDRHLSWLPHASCWNAWGVESWKAKENNLRGCVFPRFGDDVARYFALESAIKTRAMYARLGIDALRREDYVGASVPDRQTEFPGLLDGFVTRKGG